MAGATFDLVHGLRYRIVGPGALPKGENERKRFAFQERGTFVLYEPRSAFAFEVTSPSSAARWIREGAWRREDEPRLSPSDVELCSGLIGDGALAELARAVAAAGALRGKPVDAHGKALVSGGDYMDDAACFYRVGRHAGVWLAYEVTNVRPDGDWSTAYAIDADTWRPWQRRNGVLEPHSPYDHRRAPALHPAASLPSLRALFASVRR